MQLWACTPVVNELFAARKYLRSSETVSHSCTERLENRVGPSDLARERYRGLGYLSPMWWDPDIIDDPDAEPAGIRVYMKIRVEDAQGVIRYRRVLVGRRHRNTSGTCRPYAPTGPLWSIRSLFVSGLGSVT